MDSEQPLHNSRQVFPMPPRAASRDMCLRVALREQSPSPLKSNPLSSCLGDWAEWRLLLPHCHQCGCPASFGWTSPQIIDWVATTSRQVSTNCVSSSRGLRRPCSRASTSASTSRLAR
eukprot:1469146-Pleurochrysis_carterae.AAC.2